MTLSLTLTKSKFFNRSSQRAQLLWLTSGVVLSRLATRTLRWNRCRAAVLCLDPPPPPLSLLQVAGQEPASCMSTEQTCWVLAGNQARYVKCLGGQWRGGGWGAREGELHLGPAVQSTAGVGLRRTWQRLPVIHPAVSAHAAAAVRTGALPAGAGVPPLLAPTSFSGARL